MTARTCARNYGSWAFEPIHHSARRKAIFQKALRTTRSATRYVAQRASSPRRRRHTNTAARSTASVRSIANAAHCVMAAVPPTVRQRSSTTVPTYTSIGRRASTKRCVSAGRWRESSVMRSTGIGRSMYTQRPRQAGISYPAVPRPGGIVN